MPNFVRRFGVWADLDRLAHRGPDDPNDPPRLLLRLEATADGCRWLLDRWAVLRTIVDAGTPWPDEPMVQAIRLLGKRPFDAVDDLQVLTIIVATYVLDRSRPDPFAELWKTTTDREAIYYRQRLLGRRLARPNPARRSMPARCCWGSSTRRSPGWRRTSGRTGGASGSWRRCFPR